MNIDWTLLPFHALSVEQLYALLRLRVEIFMIEQNCLYPEIDGWDNEALHLMGYSDGKIALYARIFQPNHIYHAEKFPPARIGRVATHKDFRNQGLGHVLMRKALSEIERHSGKTQVILNAQSHLEKFYSRHGFNREGSEFMEDGIPHVFMIRGTQ
jgi:ElaA protein